MPLKTIRVSLSLVLTCLLLALPAAAVGQSPTPTNDVYDPADKKQSKTAGLPFGGRDIGLVLLAGTALLGTGVVVRRASRTD